jgi:hypothetical protein
LTIESEKADVVSVFFMVVGRLSPSSAVMKHNGIPTKSDDPASGS